MFSGRLLKLGEKGQALILIYMVISVFLVFSAALLTKAINENNVSVRNRLTSEAFYLAEGGTENAISAFITGIANYDIAADIETFNVSTPFSTFDGAIVNSSITRLEDDERLVLEGQTNVLARNYEIVSTVSHPKNSSITVVLHQIIARRLIPTFQHAVFYNEDLEILPGADMDLSGRVHCNKDIYLDAETGRTLTIDSQYLRSAGNFYNHRKDSSSYLLGEVSIRVNSEGPPTYADMDNLDSDSQNWTTEAINRWQGTVQSAVHGVTKLTTPSVGSIQPEGYYASHAGLVITNDVVTKDGVTLVEGVDYPTGTVSASTTFYNNREGKDIKMTDIDLRKLANLDGEVDAGGNPFPNNLPSNGLVYVTRDDATREEPGIRLKNAAQINNSAGLTVVSNDPVYIQGNFNTTDEKPASIICDSLNILSNNWNDSKDHLNVDSRVATETTVNCAFIAGIDSTTIGHYNGGLENYPRLHEKWSSINLNLKGSFVALWNSSVATGAWVYGNPQYKAPRRNWIYNTLFNDASKLPPFTPWAVEAQRVAWWKEQ